LTRRVLLFSGVAALVVLLARTLAYAAEPAPEARLLARSAGGPTLSVVALVSLSLAGAIAVAVCWLAALAVRERALVERRETAPFPLRRLAVLAVSLAVVTSVSGGLLEAYLHWRAGLGWHGLHCLVGPVHRNLLPFEAALSLCAAALVAAAQHVLGWMRRTFARLRTVPPRLASSRPFRAPWRCDLPRSIRVGSATARAPPPCA
jgi:hypothetical protein